MGNYRVIIDGVDLGSFDGFEQSGTLRSTIEAIDASQASNEPNTMRAWFEAVIKAETSTPVFTRDLIMRPTDRPAGVYEDTVVGAYIDGKNYELLWCDPGTGKAQSHPGDLVHEGVYPQGVSGLVG